MLLILKKYIALMRIEYVPVHSKKELEKSFIKKIEKFAQNKRVSLFSTIQYELQAKMLAKKIKNLIYEGNVLGCRGKIPEHEIILYLGTGKFHPIGIKERNPNVTVFIANPETNELRKLKEEEIKRIARIKAVMKDKIITEARIIGVLVSIKPGQCNLSLVKKVEAYLDKLGKKHYRIMGNNLTPEILFDFRSQKDGKTFDAFVNTACPRIFEDYERFHVPIINATDLLEKKNE